MTDPTRAAVEARESLEDELFGLLAKARALSEKLPSRGVVSTARNIEIREYIWRAMVHVNALIEERSNHG